MYTTSDSIVQGRDGGIPIRDYLPADRRFATPLLWVHGGGFVLGGLDMKESDAPARHLAAAGRWVRTVDYRLAPNIGLFGKPTLGAAPGRFPEAHHDVLDVAESLRLAAGSIHIGGASAGANLVAGAVLAMRDRGAPLPRSVSLAYGALHSVLPLNDAVESALRGWQPRWFFNPPMMRRITLNYVGDEGALADPYAFPGGADLAGYPPTLSLDASNDRLRISGHAFNVELAAAGVDTEEIVLDGVHGFLGTPRKLVFAEGMSLLALWMARHDG